MWNETPTHLFFLNFIFISLLVGNILLVLTSMVSMALPRLPQHASYLREVETLYLRWEARIAFIVYILTFACIMWIRDFGGLTTHECARISIDESFIVPLLVSIIAFGILYLVVLECYIKYCRDFKSWNKKWRTRKFTLENKYNHRH